MKYNKIVNENDIKNKNTFLVACVCSIMLLLTMFYFGVNSNLKGTAAAKVCSSGVLVGDYCCPTGYTAGVTQNGMCYNSYYSDLGNGSCIRITADWGKYNSEGWHCTIDDSLEDGFYKCITSDTSKCKVSNVGTPTEDTTAEYACYACGCNSSGCSSYVWSTTDSSYARNCTKTSFSQTNCKKEVAEGGTEVIEEGCYFYNGVYEWKAVEGATGQKVEASGQSDCLAKNNNSETFSCYVCNSNHALRTWANSTPDSASGDCTQSWYKDTSIRSENCVSSTITCPAGEYYEADTKKCAQCLATYACPGGTYYVNNSDQGIVKCAIGTTSSAGSSKCYSTGSGNIGGGGDNTGGGGSTTTTYTYKATFNANGGTLNGDSSKSCSTTGSSCSISDLPTASKSGYIFKGWGRSSSCTSGNTSNVTLSEHTTFYACYVSNSNNNDTNVDDNPKTGEITMALVWFVGIFAIAYSVYYFKQVREN